MGTGSVSSSFTDAYSGLLFEDGKKWQTARRMKKKLTVSTSHIFSDILKTSKKLFLQQPINKAGLLQAQHLNAPDDAHVVGRGAAVPREDLSLHGLRAEAHGVVSSLGDPEDHQVHPRWTSLVLFGKFNE